MKGMLLIFVMIFIFALASVAGWASVNEYSFTASNVTFVEISGGTVHGTTANDNESFMAVPIGFPFTFNGQIWNEVSINTNGFIAMGTTITSSYLALSSATGTNNVIAAMNRDIKSRADGEIMTLISGTAPNRVFTVQWKHYRRISTTAETDDWTFQIMLIEAGNKVKLAYGTITAVNVTTAQTLQVGLRGASVDDYSNRTTTTDWAATTAGTVVAASCMISATVFPASGLAFAWTPSVNETAYPVSGVIASIAGNNVNVTWTAPAPNVQTFEDGFETYADFSAIMDPWTVIDVDLSTTYGFSGITFPNSGTAMSFIVFNPSATTPALTNAAATAHGGSKYAACFAPNTPPNNDWLITPQMAANGVFKFWAKSFVADYGLERFKVGVSTAGTDPANFTIISGATYVEAPVAWTEYIYDLSAYTGQQVYVGIQCISYDAWIFMVDDVRFGYPSGLNLANGSAEVCSDNEDLKTVTRFIVAPNYDKVTNEISPIRLSANQRSFSTASAGSRDLTGYKVYRLMFGEESNEAAWQCLTNSPITATEFSDTEWTSVDDGLYRWAVKAFYTNDVVSPTAFSNQLVNGRTVTGKVVGSDQPAVGLANATINFVGYVHYTATTNASGEFTIANVYANNTYNYTVTVAGYQGVTGTLVVGATDLNMGTITVTENALPASGVVASIVVNDVNVTWIAPNPNAQTFEDNFESYADFSTIMNPWTLVDVDLSTTYGFSSITFPNSGTAMSYIVFNPSATTPALTGADAHGGSKYAACFASTTPPNNDWLITPQINARGVFKFWARSYVSTWGLERFKVGVSTTGTDPAYFTIISGASYVSAPVAWTEYSYDLSAYTGQQIRVGIQCISNDAFIFMVDDVTLGYLSGRDLANASETFGIDAVEVKTVTRSIVAPNYDEILDETSPIRFSENARFYSTTSTGSRTLTGYKVYRLMSGEESNEAAWQCLTNSPITATEFSDTQWATIDDGLYRWAVKTVYTNEMMSPAAFSNQIINTPEVISVIPEISLMMNGSITLPVVNTYFSSGAVTYSVTNNLHVLWEVTAEGLLRIYPEQDWYGSEYIQIRGVDAYGSYAEQGVRVLVMQTYNSLEHCNYGGTMPAGFSQTHSGTTLLPWQAMQDAGEDYSLQCSATISKTANERLLSGTFNLASYRNIQLSYECDFLPSAGSNATFAYTINGVTWVTIETLTTAFSGVKNFTIPALDGKSSVRLRWTYLCTAANNGSANYWKVDNIGITGIYGDVSAPDQITNFTVSGWNQSGLSLAWNPSADTYFKEYRIYYSTDATVGAGDALWTVADDSNLNNISCTNTTISGLSQNEYWLAIFAVDYSNLMSPLSAVIHAVRDIQAPVFSAPVPEGQPLPPFVNINNPTIGCTVTDQALNPGTLQYRVDANHNGVYDVNETWQVVPVRAATLREALTFSFTHDFGGSGVYRFEFRVEDMGQNIGYSGSSGLEGIEDDWVVRIDLDNPDQVSGLFSSYLDDVSIQLVWDALPAVYSFAGYEVFYATHSGVDDSDLLWDGSQDAGLYELGSGVKTTTVTGLQPGTRYYFRVRATNIYGDNGELSQEISASTTGGSLPSAPQQPSIALNGDDILLSWQAVTTDVLGLPMQIDYYEIHASTEADFIPNLDTMIDISLDNSYVHTGVVPYLERIFYRVIAVQGDIRVNRTKRKK